MTPLKQQHPRGNSMQLKFCELGFYVDLTELSQYMSRVRFLSKIKSLGYTVENNKYWVTSNFLVFHKYKDSGSCTLQETFKFNLKSSSLDLPAPYLKVSPEVALDLLEAHTLANTPVEEENPSQEATAPVESDNTPLPLSQTPEGKKVLSLIASYMDTANLYTVEGDSVSELEVKDAILRPYKWHNILTTNKTEALDKEIENLKNKIQDLETKKQQILNEG